MSVDTETIAYLAGIVDGEGYIGIRCHAGSRFVGRLAVAMNERSAVQLLSDTFGCNTTTWLTSRGTPMVKVEFNGKRSAEVAAVLLPYLRVKRRQAELLIEAYRVKEQFGSCRTRVTGTHIRRMADGREIVRKSVALPQELLDQLTAIRLEATALNGGQLNGVTSLT